MSRGNFTDHDETRAEPLVAHSGMPVFLEHSRAEGSSQQTTKNDRPSHKAALQSVHMVTGIEHVAIASPDPLRLATWYVEHLDFVINYQSANSQTVFIKAADGSMIEIIE